MLPKDDTDCHDALAHASLAVSVAASIGAAIGFLLAPMIGRLSDSYGRRFVFLFSSLLAAPAAVFLYATDQYGVSLWFCAWRVLIAVRTVFLCA